MLVTFITFYLRSLSIKRSSKTLKQHTAVQVSQSLLIKLLIPVVFFFFFLKDGDVLGGCQDGVRSCSDASMECEDTASSTLYGTCVYPAQTVPDSFGDGICRPGLYKICFIVAQQANLYQIPRK